MNRAVIFDVGSVLIHWDIRLVYRDLLPDTAAIDAFLAETGWHAWNLELDRGGCWDEAVEALGQVAEGVNTVRLVRDKARKDGVYMPLAEGLYQVLFEGVPAREMARMLMRGEQSSDVEFVLPREAVQQAHRRVEAGEEKP